MPQDRILNVRVTRAVKQRFEELARHNGWKKTDVMRGIVQKFIDDQESKLPKPIKTRDAKKQISFLK